MPQYHSHFRGYSVEFPHEQQLQETEGQHKSNTKNGVSEHGQVIIYENLHNLKGNRAGFHRGNNVRWKHQTETEGLASRKGSQ